MMWKAPNILEVLVGMEINMYVCAVRSTQHADAVQEPR
jgi:coenzyme PQQ precursor peptide PqqA